MDGTMDTRLEQLAAELAAMRDENRELRARLDALEDRPTPASAPTPATSPTPATTPTPARVTSTTDAAPRGMDRRRLLRDGLVAGATATAAATAAAVAGGQPVAAANGDELILGQANSATATTSLTVDADVDALHVTTGSPGTALTADGGIGIRTRGLAAGLQVTGDLAAISIHPPYPERPQPVVDPFPHTRGDIVADGAGDLWYCTVGGSGSNPGTFRKLVGPAAAGAFHVLPSPVRLYDSRPGTLPSLGPKSPFAPDETRTFTITGGAVPQRATAALLTLLLVNASATAGNLTVWAQQAAKPLSNSVVWGGTAGRFTATATTAIGYPLPTTGGIQVHASQRTHLVIDVVGYYR